MLQYVGLANIEDKTVYMAFSGVRQASPFPN
jgi:hypothetical protein